jgi:hypothetical protein
LVNHVIFPPTLAKHKLPTEAERLQNYFWELETKIPNPGKDWARSAKECKWLKILKERAAPE